MDAAEHIENLTAAGITHILNLASIPNRFPQVAFVRPKVGEAERCACQHMNLNVPFDAVHLQHFTYRDIELDDDPDAALEDILPMALSFIRDALAQNGVVFVHWYATVPPRLRSLGYTEFTHCRLFLDGSLSAAWPACRGRCRSALPTCC